MSGVPIILGVGVVDATRIGGIVDVSWSELGLSAPGDGRTLRRVFHNIDSTYRRLDRISRSLVLATAAAGVDGLLTAAERNATALLAESCVGCLEIDRRYTSSLAGEVIEAAIFPYTLPSTSLGEVALRHQLRGPTISISVGPDNAGASLREAERMMAAGEVRHAVAASVDVLDVAAPGLPAGIRAVVAVLAAASVDGVAVAEWPRDARDPFGELAAGVVHRPAP